VPSSLFNNSNSFYLQARFRPVFLARDEPSIDHLHSVRALLTTISLLSPHATNPSYAKLVKSELAYLEGYTGKYAQAISKFVTQGGLLTGEGIANVYFAAEALHLSPEWLQQYVHPDIPLKYQWMSRQNLQDVVAGLEKYHKDSPYLAQLKQELASREPEKPIYVVHHFNESNRYEYAEDNPSNHTLVELINSGTAYWQYYFREAWRHLASQGKYVLHNQ
jgi:hypothetical protein